MPIDIEALLQPISDSQPCGADLRNHPIFIQIREARRQEESLSQGVWAHDVKEADYGLALKLSVEALTKRGKELQVAAWLTEALVRREGFAGLGSKKAPYLSFASAAGFGWKDGSVSHIFMRSGNEFLALTVRGPGIFLLPFCRFGYNRASLSKVANSLCKNVSACFADLLPPWVPRGTEDEVWLFRRS